jgi:PleD family two-component response regulator
MRYLSIEIDKSYNCIMELLMKSKIISVATKLFPPEIPVLAFSARKDNAELFAQSNKGYEEFFVFNHKPITLVKLVKGITSLFGKPEDLNVLIAENCVISQRILESMLHRVSPKSKIMLADNPIKVVKLAADKMFSPDLIITDCDMPKMTGFEFLRRIRNQEKII